MSDSDELPDLYELWDYGKPEETEARFREILAKALEADDPDYFGQLLTQIARSRVLQGDLEEAHKLLDEADEILTAECTVGRICSFLERGRAFISSGSMVRARSLFLKAFVKSYKAHADQCTVDAVHMLGAVSEPEDAIQWNELALKLAEDSNQERARNWRGTLFNNIGWAHHEKGDYETALSYFEKGLAFRQERKQLEWIRSARWDIARALRSLERFDEALAMQRELMEEYDSEGIDEVGFTSEEIGECLWALGKKDEARPHLARA